jgi:hypothetical protein
MRFDRERLRISSIRAFNAGKYSSPRENARLRRLLAVNRIPVPLLAPENPPPTKNAEAAPPVDEKERVPGSGRRGRQRTARNRQFTRQSSQNEYRNPN